MLFADAIDSRTPALLIAVPRFKRSTENGRIRFISDPAAGARLVIVTLDAGQLQRQLLEPLVAKYFGEGSGSEYLVTIARRLRSAAIDELRGRRKRNRLQLRDPRRSRRRTADVTAGLFDLRMDELTRLVDEGARGGSPAPSARMSIAIVRRSNGADGRRVLMAGGEPHGAWEMRAAVTAADRSRPSWRGRGGAIWRSVSACSGCWRRASCSSWRRPQRQQRLARQQMEFVAAVSHELRTPLAVICSAGENLADGVVAEAAQVKRYGSLIETEGRRLGDMVERVMEFAGISSGAQAPSHASVDVAQVIADAVDGVQHDARRSRRHHCRALERHAAAGVGRRGGAAVRRAEHRRQRREVQRRRRHRRRRRRAFGGAQRARFASPIAVSASTRTDLPHIFKPFYRGRRAMDAQVRGSGVGLSVVRHVVDAHRRHHCRSTAARRRDDGDTSSRLPVPM